MLYYIYIVIYIIYIIYIYIVTKLVIDYTIDVGMNRLLHSELQNDRMCSKSPPLH